ncbi:MAG: hypothetical protein RR292_07890 [Christensenellaceae bacterium]
MMNKQTYFLFIWPIVLVVYLLVSFLTGAWYITWILFVTGGLIRKIIRNMYNN